MTTDRPITFGSLFAGIGGIDLGFERAGLQCRWQVEIDEYARRVLAKHWPEVRRHDDVRTWPQPGADYVDIIAGGFPCQDISYAGKGAGLAGERSGLFYEVMRIVGDMGPRVVVLENVAALLTRGLDSVLGSLASLGYDAEWHCIPAAAVGAPHIRDRVFILAYAKSDLFGANARSTRSSEAESRCEEKSRTLCEGLRFTNDGRSANPSDESGRNVADANSARLSERKGENASGTRAICGTKFGRSSQWNVEPNVGRVAYGVSRRMDRLRGLGNAVVPQVAEVIARMVLDSGEVGTLCNA